MTNRKLGVLAIAVAAFAGACADPGGPVVRTLELAAPSAALIPHEGVPAPSRNGLPRSDPNDGSGWVRLCKVSNVAGTFNFDVAVNGPVDQVNDISITVSAAQVNTPVCHTGPLHNSDLPAAQVDFVNIVEANPGANWTTTIDIDQWFGTGINFHPNALFDEWNVTPRTAKVYINDDMEKLATFNNVFTAPPTGNEGCTPGYWKQEQHFDSWTAPYDPGDDFDATFGVDLFDPNITLLQALELNGGKGGLNQLARAAVAALLNAASAGVNSPQTIAQVIAAVQGATPATYESVKNTFGTNNELGCPIN